MDKDRKRDMTTSEMNIIESQRGHAFRKTELIRLLETVLNKTLGEVDTNHVFDKTIGKPKITGIAGDVIEQSVLGFPADNKQRPDLYVDGVDIELKTTGIRYTKKGKKQYEAKEPMSITAVSPDKIVYEEFENSNFWHKLERMLLVYYHYSAEKTVNAADYANFYIKGYEFHEFDEKDTMRLKNDWEIVRNFIRELQNNYDEPEKEYSRISSELRNKLVCIDTAPKWPHPPRFRLKRQFLSNIIQKHFGGELQQLPDMYNSYADVDRKCHDITIITRGKTVSDLLKYYSVEYSKVSKSVIERIVVRMFGGTAKKLNKIEMFQSFGIIGKSVVLTTTGARTEDMKLFRIDFDEWMDENIQFEDSFIYDYFANHQFLYMVFEEPSIEAQLSENKFLGFKRVDFDDNFLENEVKKVWLEVRRLIKDNLLEETMDYKDGKPVVNANGVIKSSVNFPKSRDYNVFVRGSSTDSGYKNEIVNGIRMYRQYIWIKGSYIARILQEKDYL